MNNFKKFVAVLLGVVMACVFATSAFAAEVQNTDKAKAEIKSFLAGYGVKTVDNTVDNLTPAQLTYIRDNMDSLKAAAADAKTAFDGAKNTTEAAAAVNNAVATGNSILAGAGVTVSATTSVEGDEIVVNAAVSANGTKDVVGANKDFGSKTTSNTQTSSAVASAAQNSAAATSVKTVSSAANPITASSSAVIKATGDNTAVVFVVAALAVAGVLGMAVRKERAL